MYKKQMKLQKAVCLFVLAASVIIFLYSLGIMTDLYESLYFTIRNPDNPSRNPVQALPIRTYSGHKAPVRLLPL